MLTGQRSTKSYVDLVIPSLSLATDFKSVGGFSYKMAVGDRGAPEGPKREHLIQAGIGALLTGMENVSVLYLARARDLGRGRETERVRRDTPVRRRMDRAAGVDPR